MNRFRYVILLMAACLLLVGCGRGNASSGSTGTSPTNQGPGGEPIESFMEFHYGRLSLPTRFVKLMGNGIDFTLHFDKTVITPQNDIVLTVYVTNYTGGDLNFQLKQPVVSLGQLIHASLTYGDGTYTVPVTVDYSPDPELGGGTEQLIMKDKKLISAKVTFHTSSFENIENSIFCRDFADSYEMVFWFGEDEYTYRAETQLIFSEIKWPQAEELQSLIFPKSYVKLVDDVRFTLTFSQTTIGTDEDIRMHAKVENLGTEPLELKANFDVSSPNHYIRAEMMCGEKTSVRDNVANPSEIVGVESSYLLKHNEVLERDIEFYTSDFVHIERSVYCRDYRDRCTLKVWLSLGEQSCEMTVPLTYGDYAAYSYHDQELPNLPTTEVPVLSTTTSSETTATIPPETTTETQTATETVGTTSEPDIEPDPDESYPEDTDPEDTDLPDESAATSGEATTASSETTAATTGETTTVAPAGTTTVSQETPGETTTTSGETSETSNNIPANPGETVEEPPAQTTPSGV